MATTNTKDKRMEEDKVTSTRELVEKLKLI